MEKIKVVSWGLGNMGRGMAEMVLDKEGLELVGAIEKYNGIGEDLGTYLGRGKLGICIEEDPRAVLEAVRPDVVLLAIHSFVKGVVEEIELIARLGGNVVTIAEEMAYPFESEPELSKRIDAAAKAHGVSVLGTGVNPGFVLDTLIVQLSMAVRSVRKIRAARVNDLSPFGKTVMVEQGVGLSVDAFKKGVEDGSVYGHVGFLQSIPMVAKALGLKYDEIRETREPIVSKVRRETKDALVEPGMVAGCNHKATAYLEGEAVIVMEHPQQILPELEELETGDYIEIHGDPDIRMQIAPEVPGGIGTIAAAVNAIPHVLGAAPGLVTMLDLPVVHAIMDDFRNHVNK